MCCADLAQLQVALEAAEQQLGVRLQPHGRVSLSLSPEGVASTFAATAVQASSALSTHHHPHSHALPTASVALQSAKAAASRQGHLLALPAWARMPGRLQRHWLRYCLAGWAAAWAVRFMYRHSRLSGSDDLERCVGAVPVLGGA